MNRLSVISIAIFAALLTLGGCGAARQHQQIQQKGAALRYDLAQLYVNKGVPQAAVPLLQKILSEDPKDVRARVLYANVLRDIGLLPQAEREYMYALKLAPKMAAAHAGLGILADLQHRSTVALEHHMYAVRLEPGNAAYRNNLGFSLYLAGKNDEAIKMFEQVLAMDPGLAVAYNNLGFAYGKRGDFEKAEQTFRAGNGEAAALLNMAMVYDDRGDHARAEESRQKAYLLEPDLQPVAAAKDDEKTEKEATP